MTLPDERTRAVLYTRSFLLSLQIPKETPGVPKAIRDEARRLLKHYPGDYHLSLAAKNAPDVFESPKEDDYALNNFFSNVSSKSTTKRVRPTGRANTSRRGSKTRSVNRRRSSR